MNSTSCLIREFVASAISISCSPGSMVSCKAQRETSTQNLRECCIQVQTECSASLFTSIREWSTKTLRVTLLACSPADGRGMTPPCVVLLLYGPLWLLSTYTPACTSTPHHISSGMSCCFHYSTCSQPLNDVVAVWPAMITVYIQSAWTDPGIHVSLVIPLLCCAIVRSADSP